MSKIKLFINANSGANIHGFVNPNIVNVQPDTDDLNGKSYKMPETYFAPRSIVEFDSNDIGSDMAMAMDLISLEQTRGVVRIGASYKEKSEIGEIEIDNKLVKLYVPNIDAVNNMAIYEFWIKFVKPEAKKEFVEDTKTETV